MNTGFVEHTLHWITTPDELRKIANRMEEKFKTALLGDRTIVKHIEIAMNDNVLYAIDVSYDQERM